jgi:hypothetical protein
MVKASDNKNIKIPTEGSFLVIPEGSVLVIPEGSVLVINTKIRVIKYTHYYHPSQPIINSHRRVNNTASFLLEIFGIIEILRCY